MNLSTTIFLLNKTVRPVRVSYDPDLKPGYSQDQFFKTLDPDLKKDDMVVVPTGTRHGMTVCKVVEIDFPVDFDGAGKWQWIVGRVDVPAYENILTQEETILGKVRKAEENRKRKELAETMHLAEVDFTDLDLVNGSTALPSPPTPKGQGQAPAA